LLKLGYNSFIAPRPNWFPTHIHTMRCN